MNRIDLNADLGESVGDDAAMMRIVSSASIACGGHAGDAASMREAARMAKVAGVVIGAHPGFEDRANFGRVRLDLPLAEIGALVGAQVAALMRIAGEEGAEVRYVKLHGALANMAAEDSATARAAFGGVPRGLTVLALAGSDQVWAARELGLGVVEEAYADRGYLADGMLAPRSLPGAVKMEGREVTRQAVDIARGKITAMYGTVISTAARSICVHGDTPGAVALAKAVRQALEGEGVTVSAFA